MKTLKILSFLLFSAIANVNAQSDWERIRNTSTEGLGGQLKVGVDMIQLGDTLFAIHSKKLLKYDNGNWINISKRIKINLDFYFFCSLRKTNFTSYIFTSEGVVSSINDGKTWTFNKYPNDNFNFKAATLDNNRLIATETTLNASLSRISKVYFSDDNGKTWIYANKQFPDNYIPFQVSKNVVAFTNSYYGIENISATNSIEYTIDGLTFTPFSLIGYPNGGSFYDRSITGNDSYAYGVIASSSGGFKSKPYRYNYTTKEWIQISNGLLQNDYGYGIQINKNKLYFYSNLDTMYSSINNGDSWQSDTLKGIDKNLYFRFKLTETNNGCIAVFRGVNEGFDEGNNLFYYTTDNVNWKDVNSTLNYSFNEILYSFKNTIFTINDIKGLKRSKDNGNSWDLINTTDFDNNYISSKNYSLSSTNDNLFLQYNYKNPHVYNEINNKWEAIGLPPKNNTDEYVFRGAGEDKIFELVFDNTNKIKAYYSSNKGATWTQFGQSIAENLNSDFAQFGNNIYAITNNLLFKSTDNGVNFALDTSGIGNSQIIKILKLDDKLYLETDRKLYIKKINDNKWIHFTDLSYSINYFTIKNNTVYIINSANTINYSNDNGVTWKVTTIPDLDKVGDTYISSILVLDNNTIILSSGSNGLLRKNSLISNIKNTAASEFTIYPNPANELLNFKTEVTMIKIYDILGQIILSQDILSNNINIAELKSGTYYITGISNSKNIIKQVFIKQ